MNWRLKLLLFVLIVLFVSCYSRKEGCSDILAENYEVSADDACQDCCIYPKLQLNLLHMIGDSTFNSVEYTQKILLNEKLQSYRILDIRYYLSAFQLYNKTTGQKKIIEYISSADKKVFVPDDMKICRYADGSVMIGSIKDSGMYDSLSFYVGLTDSIMNASFADLPADHVLLSANRLKNAKGDYAHFLVKIERISSNDTLDFQITGPSFAHKLSIDSTIFTRKGEKPIFSIKTDYLLLFKDIDLTQSFDSIEIKLKRNIPKSFIVN